MTIEKLNEAGLTSACAAELQNKYGKNELTPMKKESFIRKALRIICEPMFLLLIVAAIIYFILGEPRDGAIMLVFVIGMISIDAIQEWKTDKTLNALKNLSSPNVTVIRDGKEKNIAAYDLVPGDIMIIFEGVKIPADGTVIKCNDLCVDESCLTGESEAVWKLEYSEEKKEGKFPRRDYCYAGTLVTQGTGYIKVEKTGALTEYGKIGRDIANAPKEKTPLQRQIAFLVKTCAFISVILLCLVGVFTYLNLTGLSIRERIVESVLSGITLAMAMIPEEFPVILTVFLSMGAWRLAKKNSLVRKLPSVETLGAVSVLCVDKTGTITVNRMTVQEVWSKNGDENGLITVMGKGCETNAYDPMEKAMLSYCETNGILEKDLFKGKLIHEYPFTNELKMMGHVWQEDSEILIAAKGSPEQILKICNLTCEEKKECEDKIKELSSNGLRVIAIACEHLHDEEKVPEKITDCSLTLLGIVGLADPPRENIQSDIAICNKAGIRVVMITGDNGDTAVSVAKKIGIKHCDSIITGEMLDNMTDDELREKVKKISVFSRVVPQHKMRIVKALKDNGEIVAMTGDGVNDAPALKYADIGIAMGKRGSEVSREAADLILLDDNFTTVVETVKDGRRIYDNIRKAVGYVFSIHVPIALASLSAPLLGIASPALFLLPLHVVLLELIIDPTCSIILERQPAESDVMERKPRNPKEKILNSRLFIKSILQGLCIFAASFITYYKVLGNNASNAPLARAMGLTVIIISNVLLVLVNSSECDFVFRSVIRLAKDKLMWCVGIGTILGLAVILYSPAVSVLKLEAPSAVQLLICVGVSAVSVLWYEAVKLVKRILKRKQRSAQEK